MARKSKIPTTPCECIILQPRIIVEGEPPAPHVMWGTRLGPNDVALSTPAYDIALKQWFLSEYAVLPDPDRDALICNVCDAPTDGLIGFDDGIDEVAVERELAGLNPVWQFAWRNPAMNGWLELQGNNK